MNDTEVTMQNALPKNPLIAHSKALEAAGMAIALVIRVPAPLKSIADQAIRAAPPLIRGSITWVLPGSCPPDVFRVTRPVL